MDFVLHDRPFIFHALVSCLHLVLWQLLNLNEAASTHLHLYLESIQIPHRVYCLWVFDSWNLFPNQAHRFNFLKKLCRAQQLYHWMPLQDVRLLRRLLQLVITH